MKRALLIFAFIFVGCATVPKAKLDQALSSVASLETELKEEKARNERLAAQNTELRARMSQAYDDVKRLSKLWLGISKTARNYDTTKTK